jgi:hypothetical protein
MITAMAIEPATANGVARFGDLKILEFFNWFEEDAGVARPVGRPVTLAVVVVVVKTGKLLAEDVCLPVTAMD